MRHSAGRRRRGLLKNPKQRGNYSMKNLIRFFLGFGFLASIAFYGCQADPQQEIKAARRAMEEAKDFHSEELAATEWKEAMQAWEEAQSALKKGDHPKDYFQKARVLFEKTITAAQAKGSAMEKEIDEVQKTINESYLKVKATLKEGRIKPKIQKELKPLLDEVAIDSSSVKDLIMHSDYTQAMAKVCDTQKKMRNAEMVLFGQKIPQLEIEKRR
jgi:hypothetical protein